MTALEIKYSQRTQQRKCGEGRGMSFTGKDAIFEVNTIPCSVIRAAYQDSKFSVHVNINLRQKDEKKREFLKKFLSLRINVCRLNV
jgi:hypothetical protein